MEVSVARQGHLLKMVDHHMEWSLVSYFLKTKYSTKKTNKKASFLFRYFLAHRRNHRSSVKWPKPSRTRLWFWVWVMVNESWSCMVIFCILDVLCCILDIFCYIPDIFQSKTMLWPSTLVKGWPCDDCLRYFSHNMVLDWKTSIMQQKMCSMQNTTMTWPWLINHDCNSKSYRSNTYPNLAD